VLYANIIVDISHEKLDKTFQYIIPLGMENKIHPGVMVVIPFGKGNREITGYVLSISTVASFEQSKLKYILSIVENSVPIEGRLIKLADFIKNRYATTMNQALKTVIPVKTHTKNIEKKEVILNIDKENEEKLRSEFQKKRAVAKLRLLEELLVNNAIDYDILIKKLNISSKTIKEFEDRNIIKIESERVYRNPVQNKEVGEYNIILTKEQEEVANNILNSDKKIHLIHGITGSGKTEIYIKLIEETIKEGKKAIVLIPEIALTYQTVMRFRKKFKDRVSIVNSRLSKGEKYDQFELAKKGLIDIMIGPRSAIFTPFENLGLIIIDEEHESAYKSENIPKYHAKEVGIFRLLEEGGKMVLGSATPMIDTYYKCKTGEYELHELLNRPMNIQLPNVTVVDLREELQKGNRTVFSEKLNELILDRLEKKQQIMLFINRRGYAGFVSCRSCGKVMKCPHCDVGLTFHNNDTIVCHYCNYTIPSPKTCPECKSKYIATFGIGTQKIEEMVKKVYPMARVLRMDMDTTKGKHDHENILSQFANQEADILIGTQMIVKGHDFKNVTLVGVVAADLSLYATDYRAAENTFDLLTQASGRAGRGEYPGEVIIQTYSPENYAIGFSAGQDYKGFYEREILYRTLMEYPPAVSMYEILIQSENAKELKDYSKHLKQKVEEYKKDREEFNLLRLIGPAPATVNKIKDIYRDVFYIKDPSLDIVMEIKDFIISDLETYSKKDYISIVFDLLS
jgi:primosomal protein N' (replication factor Y)